MIYVMSDIHGNKKAFEDILNQIQLQPKDTLYILGDVIDRGEYGIEILIKIMTTPNIKMLLGNHEYMLLKSLNPINPQIIQDKKSLILWRKNYCEYTEKKLKNLDIDTYKRLYAFLDSLPININIKIKNKKFKLVHGSPIELYDETIDFNYIDEVEFALWNSLTVVPTGLDYIVVFGHVPTINFQNHTPLKIYKEKNMIGIDCGCGWISNGYNKCRLACLRLDDMKEFYSKCS